MRPLALTAFLCVACLERPYEQAQGQQARPQVDRDALKDVLQPPPADAIPVGALFGNSAELLAYKVEPPALVAGQRTRVTLYWRCKAELEAWHIFVHLDGARTGERIHAEHDPAGGRFPTEAWKTGDFITDAFTFVPGQEPLLLFLGFYSEGEARLPLITAGRGRDNGQNRLLVGLLNIAK